MKFTGMTEQEETDKYIQRLKQMNNRDLLNEALHTAYIQGMEDAGLDDIFKANTSESLLWERLKLIGFIE
jgi:hypothetical protein